MAPLDDKTLADFKLSQARTWQQFFASDGYWKQLPLFIQNGIIVLRSRKKLQALARRYEKRPICFCERLMGRHWFDIPKGVSARQLLTFSEIFSHLPEVLNDPAILSQLDPQLVVRTVKALTARPLGRRRLEIYAKASELRDQGKAIHQICILLVHGYTIMSAAERSVKRGQMRSGIARFQNATQARQG